MPKDLLDRTTEALEDQLLELYDGMRTLLAAAPPPCVSANLRAALAHVAVAVTDLGLRFEHLLDDGC